MLYTNLDWHIGDGEQVVELDAERIVQFLSVLAF